MYEKLTEKAQKVFKYARQEAQQMGLQQIGTEHLLLGILREGTGVAATILQHLGVDTEKIRAEVEKIAGGAAGTTSGGREFALTPPAKKAFEYAFEESRQLRQNYIGTEHLLLGLLKEEEGIAAQVLHNLGVELQDVQEAVMELVGPPGAEPDAVAISLPWTQAVQNVLDEALATAKAHGRSRMEVQDLVPPLLNWHKTLRPDAVRPLRELRAKIDQLLQCLHEPGSRDSERPGDGETQ